MSFRARSSGGVPARDATGSTTVLPVVRAVGFLASLAAFVLVRQLTHALPWWSSVLLAVLAMLLVGRLVGGVALAALGGVRRRRGQQRRDQPPGATTRW